MRKEAAVSLGDDGRQETGEIPNGRWGLGSVLGGPQLCFSGRTVNGTTNSVAVQIPKVLPGDLHSAELGWAKIDVIRMNSEYTCQAL